MGKSLLQYKNVREGRKGIEDGSSNRRSTIVFSESKQNSRTIEPSFCFEDFEMISQRVS
jgi:hypothetical protein